MSEKFCLKWNDFQENINSAFGNLSKEREFADVTLACEDGQQVEAHKMILAASSPFFRNLFQKNKHSHPLIYMRGVQSEILLAVIDFLYLGEANVFQQDLDSFLALAEELKLKGLMGRTQKSDEKDKPMREDSKPFSRGAKFDKERTNLKDTNEEEPRGVLMINNEFERTISIPNSVPGDLKELDEKVKSMMEKGQNRTSDGRFMKICKVCGKEGAGIAIRDHIEANHLDGIALPCDVCGKIFRSRCWFRKHSCSKK